jgi:transcriptional regulator with XRE-family HTH domain
MGVQATQMNGRIDYSAIVRSIRHARGITQEKLARDLEVTFSTVNGWENGRHQPIPSLARQLLELAHAAGVLPRARAPQGPVRRRPRRRDRG